jgi:hypothetical protein
MAQQDVITAMCGVFPDGSVRWAEVSPSLQDAGSLARAMAEAWKRGLSPEKLDELFDASVSCGCVLVRLLRSDFEAIPTELRMSPAGVH